MSFFYEKKSEIMDSSFLWCFAFLVAISCAWFHQYNIQKAVDNERNIYTLQYHEFAPEKTIHTNASTCEPTNLYAGYAALMDADNSRILFEKNGDKKVPMASTTKIMTLLVALENANLEDTLTVSDYAASMPDVQLGIQEGEQYRLKDLVYSLMLESHNDSAVAIAEHVGGDVEGFAKMMNEKAKELGAYQTNFVTPNGLDAVNHYTTAKDLARIAGYAMKNKTFRDIIRKKTHTFHEQTTGKVYTVNNKDRFLDLYEGAMGIKTGFTGNAGYCFVGAASKNNKSFISVVLASGWPPNKNYKWSDTVKLMDYGMKEYNYKTIVEKNISFQEIPTERGIDNVKIVPYVKENISMLLRNDEKVTYEIDVPKKLKAPVKKDETIGSMTIKIEDKTYRVIPILSKNSCRKLTYPYVQKKILYYYFGLG